MGAVDGFHIPIIAPPEYHADYFNHKGWHSVLVQGVVDPSYRFWDINVGFKEGERGVLFPNWIVKYHHVDVPLLIIGAPAYPLLEWLMKPYSDTGRLTSQQLTFNYRLSRACNVAENAFDCLKARWHCLLKCNDSYILNMFVSKLLLVAHFTIYVRPLGSIFMKNGCNVFEEHSCHSQLLLYCHRLPANKLRGSA